MRPPQWFTTKRLENIINNYQYYENRYLASCKRELDKRYRKRDLKRQADILLGRI